MRLLYATPCRQTPPLPLPVFLEQAAGDGFDAVEIHLASRLESPAEVRSLCAGAGLLLIVQVATEGAGPEEHARSLEEQYARALKAAPLLVSSRTGRDVFDFEDNVRLFVHAQDLASSAEVPLLHETRRGSALFSAPATAAYLRAIPGLRLSADLAQWLCVHESDLSDQPDAVDAAVGAAHHLRARVGSDQGPQVADPRSQAAAGWLSVQLALWRRIVSARRAGGLQRLTITPEYEPAAGASIGPANGEPPADARALGLWLRDRLSVELDGGP